MKHNFQIMNNKNENGKYIPDMETLKNNASCKEEVDYINTIEAKWEEYKEKGYTDFIGFTFNMCYITKQSCGHYEIYQISVNNEEEALKQIQFAEEEAKNRKCTKCICNW